jgi:hypothetical protein
MKLALFLKYKMGKTFLSYLHRQNHLVYFLSSLLHLFHTTEAAIPPIQRRETVYNSHHIISQDVLRPS